MMATILGFFAGLGGIIGFALLAGSSALLGDLSKDLVRSLAGVIASRATRILPDEARADLQEQWLSDLADLKDRSALFVFWTAVGFVVAAFPLARAARAEARAALAADGQPSTIDAITLRKLLRRFQMLKSQELSGDRFSHLPEESQRVARALASFSAKLASMVVAALSLVFEFASMISRVLLQFSRQNPDRAMFLMGVLAAIPFIAISFYAAPYLKAVMDEVTKFLVIKF